MELRNGGAVRILTLAAVGLLVIGARGADNPLEAVFQRMDAAAAKFKGMTADMKRLSHEGALGEEETSTGTIVVKAMKPRDVRMLLDFKGEDAKTVEVSGTKADIYFPKAAEIQEYDFGKSNRTLVEQFLKLGFGSTSREMVEAYTVDYGGKEKLDGQDTARLVLIPKSKDVAAQFPKFELWISNNLGIAIQQKLYQPGGSYNVVTYSNVRINPNISDSDVKFKNLPKGVKTTPVSR